VHSAGLLDIAPTALTLLGLPVGADMDGRVLVEAMDRPVEIARVPSWEGVEGEAGLHPPDLRVDPFEARSAMDQLADLGYVEASTGDSKADLAMCARETRFNLGVVLMTTSRQSAAVEVFEQLHAEYPKDPRFAMNLAHCLSVTGAYGRAAQVLEHLIAELPASPDARLMQGSALLMQGKVEEAAGALREAARRAPKRPDVLCALASACILLKQFDEAGELTRRAAAIDPHDPAVHHQLAQLAIARERYEEGAEYALRALELRHLFPEAHYTLGVALAWLDQCDYAAQSFKIAVSMQPGMAEAIEFLALLSRHKGDESEGRRLHEEAERFFKTRGAGAAADLSRGTRMDPGVWGKHAGVEKPSARE
jgi:tetratricopeptide (TPR) repeat protein